MTYKERFPTEAALEAVVDAELSKITEAVKVAAGPLEADYLLKKRWTTVSVWLCSTGAIILGFFISDVGVAWVKNSSVLLISALAGGGIGCIVLGVYVWKYSRKFENDFVGVTKTLLYAEAFRLLDLSTGKRIISSSFVVDGKVYQKKSSSVNNPYIETPEKQQVISWLNYSELVTEPRNTLHVDDVVSFTHQHQDIFSAELDITHITGSGKHRNVKKIFHGCFVWCELSKPVIGKTFVSTEGDRNGFGHRSFWTSRSSATAQETTLEWNDFENLLHVATTNPIEARVILTPDFMIRLYDWWKDHKQNIRISFIGSHMYVLFPSESVFMFTSIRKIDSTQIREEILAICKPLLPILHLAEALPKS